MQSHKIKSPVLFVVFIASILVLGQVIPGGLSNSFAAADVAEVIVVPRNYNFTWGSSGASIVPQNTVYCSSNPDYTRVLYWRTTDTVSGAGVNDWNPTIITAGNYDIYVYIPDYTHTAAITTQARYYFNGGLLNQIDQNQNKCSWVYLGRRYMAAGTGDTISLPAQTGENPFKLISADGMKFVYVSSSISGRVVDSNNNPFSGVTITLNTGQSTTTDANGNFVLSSLDPGTYTITPSSASGLVFSPANRTIAVPPDATGQDFTVSNRYSISGRLSDTLGNAIPNTTVYIQGLSMNSSTVSDSNGRYTFYNLVAGVYQVKPDAMVYGFSPVVRGWMFVPPNQTGQDFTSAPVYSSISGKVTNQTTSSPIVNAQVNLAGKTTQTDGSGNYLLTGLLPGQHMLHVSAGLYNDSYQNVNLQAGVSFVQNVALKPILADGYRLPFAGGKTLQLTNTTHSSGYAQDWARGQMNGDDVVASRAGKVVDIKDDSNIGGPPDADGTYCKYGNYVQILHSDSTSTFYVHLRQYSVRNLNIKKYDYVKAGQVIGKSGATGCRSAEHIHFAWMVNNKRAVPNLLDVPGGVPVLKQWYASGNYMTGLLSNFELDAPLADTTPPVGSFHYQLTGLPTYKIRVDAFDYDSDVVQMRVATTEPGLSSAAWSNVTGSFDWTAPIIWGQFKDASANVSTVYSETIDAIAYEPLQAAFSVDPTVCAGSEPVIQNQTFPLCEQCGWQWDYGDGNTSQLAYPSLPFMTSVYTSTGIYNISLTAKNVNSSSSVSHQVVVLPSPSTGFTIVRNGTNITVDASDKTASSWQWDFGDGSSASGSSATHSYADFPTMEASLVTLSISNSFGCSGVGFTPILPLQTKIFLPAVLR